MAASAVPAVPTTRPSHMHVLALLCPGHSDQGTASEQPDTIPIRPWLDAWAGFIAHSYSAACRNPDGTEYTRPCEQAVPARGATIPAGAPG
ncbi:hypothetical protein [Streptomyces chartreusis]